MGDNGPSCARGDPDAPPPRQDWIDVARGIGISLVIVGHVIISSRDAGQIARVGFWGDVVFTIYTFHMPLFLFLAGLSVPRRLRGGARGFLAPLLVTLVWPYLLWGALVLVAERAFAGVRNPVDTSIVDISLLWTPIAWLWFLWALAIFHVAAAACRTSSTLLAALALGAWAMDGVVTLPPFAHQLAHFLIFYAGGVMVGRVTLRPRISPRAGIAAAALFAPLAWLPFAMGQDAWSFWASGAAVAGTVVVVAIAQRVPSGALLIFLGRRSMGLYVSHIFFNTATRVVLSRVFANSDFAVVFPTGLLASFSGPLILSRLAERAGVMQLAGFGRPLLAPAGRR